MLNVLHQTSTEDKYFLDVCKQSPLAGHLKNAALAALFCSVLLLYTVYGCTQSYISKKCM